MYLLALAFNVSHSCHEKWKDWYKRSFIIHLGKGGTSVPPPPFHFLLLMSQEFHETVVCIFLSSNTIFFCYNPLWNSPFLRGHPPPILNNAHSLNLELKHSYRISQMITLKMHL